MTLEIWQNDGSPLASMVVYVLLIFQFTMLGVRRLTAEEWIRQEIESRQQQEHDNMPCPCLVFLDIC
jgi:hypothetical protein